LEENIYNKYKFPREILDQYDNEYLQYTLPFEILLDINDLFSHEYVEQQREYLLKYKGNKELIQGEIINKNIKISLIVDHIKDPIRYNINTILSIFNKYKKFGIKPEEEITISNPRKLQQLFTDDRLNELITEDLVPDTEIKIKASIGYLTILNLYKVAKHLINARGTGKYRRITKQPTRGRKQQGGSKLGNDEVSMILAYDSEYLIKELIFIKSDDHTNKLKFIKEFPIKGNFSIENDIEEFNSYSLDNLNNLLRALNINLDNIESKNNE